jgi:hypothetical protein
MTITRVLATLSLCWLSAACSAVPGENKLFGDSNGASSAGANGAGGGAGSGSSSSGDDGMLGFDGGMSGGGGLDEDAACASTGAEAGTMQLDMLILLDRSGSMYGQNWNGVTAAIKQFVVDPASSGMNVALLYFPIDDPDDGLVCNKDHYKDVVVPFGQLPQNSQAVVQSIDAESPNGGSTPMYGAVAGALSYATAYKDQNPNHKVIMIFASDGDPNSCPGNQNDMATIAALAQSALNYNGVETYVIAISGASVSNLDQIAAGGGTGKAYDVTGNVLQFAQKMNEIRGKALACEYVIPPPPGNQPLELDRVAVKYQDGSGNAKEIPYADSLADCGSTAGWYYNDPKNPTKIELCPASCTEVQGNAQGSVKVLFGCKPQIN